MRPRDLIVVGLLGGVLVAAGCREQGAVARLPERPAAPAAPDAGASPPALVTESGATVLNTSPALSGTLEPHRRSTLTPRVAGPIAKVHVREGDVVRKGALLVTVDQEQYQLILRQVEAGLAGARVKLDAVKVEYDRAKALLADKAIPQSQWDRVEAEHRGAVVGIQAAEVALDMARKSLRDTLIRAPYPALVVKRHVSEGDYAASMPPTPLITVDQVDILDLRVQVPSSDFDRVREKDEIEVRFPSIGKTVKAKVTRVVWAIDPRTRTFPVLVELKNKGQELRSGLFATVRLAPAQAATPQGKRP
jgi:multidrug efflux system membrane fusion protein